MVTAIWIICGLFLVVTAVVRLRSAGANRGRAAILVAAGAAIIVIGFFV